MTAPQAISRLHPVTFEVLRNAFVGVANEMGATLAKVGYSPVITEGRDFSGSLYDAAGRLVACGELDLPGLLGMMEPSIQLILDDFGVDQLHPGDVILVNSPHEGGSHLNDMKCVMPVFLDGELIAFVGNVGHWADMGGATPGSFSLTARESFAEGLFVPPLKIIDRGVMRQDVLKLILRNIRIPHEATGDLQAQIKSCEVGERRLLDLIAKYGWETVETAFAATMDHAERILWREMGALPDGEYTFEDRIDEDPLADSHDPVVIRLRFTKSGDELVFDFTEADPDPMGALGCSRAFTCSGVYLAVLNLFPGIPFNHGVVRNCRVLTKPGTATEAVFPSSVSGAASGAFEKVLGAVFGAIGKADPSRQVGGTCNLMNIVIGGTDPRLHRPFVLYVWNEGGYGGSPRGDGGNSPTLYPYATGSRNQPVEVHERLYPVRYHKAEIRYDSCGAGTFRGGPGIVHRMELTDGEAVLSCWGDRERYPPWGVNGGWPGGGHHIFVNPGMPQEKSLGMFWTGERIKAGDVFEAISSGGGGWGDPRARDPELVLHDVAEGMLDIETAARVYGVAIVCHDSRRRVFSIDNPKTAQLRQRGASDSPTDLVRDRGAP